MNKIKLFSLAISFAMGLTFFACSGEAVSEDNDLAISSSSVEQSSSSSIIIIEPPATFAPLLQPIWPQRNVRISSIKNFAAYISYLDDPNAVISLGKENIILDPEEVNENCKFTPTDFMDMSAPTKHQHGYMLSLSPERDYSNVPQGCKYIWKIKIGESTMDVPFLLDAIPPTIKLTAELPIITNPQPSDFFINFETNEGLSFIVFLLKHKGAIIASCKSKGIIGINTRYSYRIGTFKNINDETELSYLEDGEYEVVSYAFDGAVASIDEYNARNRFLDGRGSTIFAIFDLIDKDTDELKYSGINMSKNSVSFVVVESSSSSD